MDYVTKIIKFYNELLPNTRYRGKNSELKSGVELRIHYEHSDCCFFVIICNGADEIARFRGRTADQAIKSCYEDIFEASKRFVEKEVKEVIEA